MMRKLHLLAALAAIPFIAAACGGSTGFSQVTPTPSKAQTSETIGETVLVTRERAVIVNGESLDVGLADRIERISGVTKVTRYLVVPAEPHDVIGVDVEGELRAITLPGEPTARIIEGEGFRPEDAKEPVAVVGRNVAQDDYGSGPGAMTGMRHAFPIGAVLRLTQDSRARVIGYFATGFAEGDDKVFLPLDTAQQLFGKGGQVTHIYVEVEQSGQVGQVVGAIKGLLAGQ